MDYKLFKNRGDIPRNGWVAIVYQTDDFCSQKGFVISEYKRGKGIRSEVYFHVGEYDDRILKSIDSKEIWVQQEVEEAFLTVYEDALIYKEACGIPWVIKELKRLEKKNKMRDKGT